MKFTDFSWADTQIENIQIEYDSATLTIWNYWMKQRFVVRCSSLAGITNLCIWDDTIIWSTTVTPVTEVNNDFLRQLFTAYDRDFDYGGRILGDGLLELNIELVNYISFQIYCQNIDVQLSEDQKDPRADYVRPPFTPYG